MMQSPIYLHIIQPLVILHNLDRHQEFQSHKPEDHHVHVHPNNANQGCNHACIATLSLRGSQVSTIDVNLGITK